MKSTSERQKNRRDRLKASGLYRQINLPVTTEAFNRLQYLSIEHCVTQATLLEVLLLAHVSDEAATALEKATKIRSGRRDKNKIKPTGKTVELPIHSPPDSTAPELGSENSSQDSEKLETSTEKAIAESESNTANAVNFGSKQQNELERVRSLDLSPAEDDELPFLPLNASIDNAGTYLPIKNPPAENSMDKTRKRPRKISNGKNKDQGSLF